MKKFRILSLITAAALPLSLISCTLRDHNRKSSSSSKEDTVSSEKNQKSDLILPDNYQPADISEIRDHAKKLLEDIKITGNTANVQADIDVLINDIDICYEAHTRISIPYYLDWNNNDLETEYDNCSKVMYVAYELVNYSFCQGYIVNEYNPLFEQYVTDDLLEYYTDPDMSLYYAEAYAREDFDLMDEQLDEYYDISGDDEMSDKEKNIQCAEVYLDLLASYDTNTFYSQYNRDYSPEDIIQISSYIKSYLIPVYEKLCDSFYDSPGSGKIFSDPVAHDNPYEEIIKYTPRLSEDIKTSSEKIFNEKLYTYAAGNNCYTGSFTDELPLENSAMVYVYCADDFYDITTAIHEFGHFYAAHYDDIPMYMAVNNIDIAEIQSQAMEILFMQFYDELFGDQAEAMKLLQTIDLMDSVICGFLVAEFEYTVLSNINTMSAEDVVNCFDKIFSVYSNEYDLYYISHIFESPGYYVSYGVSALAAFDIYNDVMYAPESALEKYEKMAHIPYNSKDYQFQSALKECGYSNVLSENYIKNLATQLSSLT